MGNGSSLVERVETRSSTDGILLFTDPGASAGSVSKSRTSAEPLLQMHSHFSTGLLADQLSYGGLDGKHVGAVA